MCAVAFFISCLSIFPTCLLFHLFQSLRQNVHIIVGTTHGKSKLEETKKKSFFVLREFFLCIHMYVFIPYSLVIDTCMQTTAPHIAMALWLVPTHRKVVIKELPYE